jgi:hypothetical protein
MIREVPCGCDYFSLLAASPTLKYFLVQEKGGGSVFRLIDQDGRFLQQIFFPDLPLRIGFSADEQFVVYENSERAIKAIPMYALGWQEGKIYHLSKEDQKKLGVD